MPSPRDALPCALLVIVGFHAGSAQAQPHQVCIYLDLGADLWDASPRAADGEDFREEYGRNEGPTSYPAQRWLAHVVDARTGTGLFGWEPLDGSGCASFDLPDGAGVLGVEWVRWAVWEDDPDTGNQIVGYSCTTEMMGCSLTQSARLVPADIGAGVTEVIVTQDQIEPIDGVMWVASFAEERFASLGEQPLEDARIYVSHDPAMLLPGKTQADRTFGNQPSVIIQGKAWHSKFTVAHEYGHLQTVMAANPSFGRDDLDYCYDATLYPLSAIGCTPNHSVDGHEWQAVAAVEGIASWYSVSVWNDVDLVECQNCQSGVRYVHPTSETEALTYAVPRGSPLCTAMGEPQCPAGVGNEWDWMSAFRLFRLQAPMLPSFRTLFTMLSAAYQAGTWPPAAADGSFWEAVDLAMVDHLGPHYAAWSDAATQMELDR